MSDPVRPHRRQPTRLPHPWDSPGKNTGVGCHFLPMNESEKWKWSLSVMSDSRDPMDCSLLGSSLHGIFQARVLEWGAMLLSHEPWAMSHEGSPRILEWVAYPCLMYLANLGIILGSPELQAYSLPAQLLGRSQLWSIVKSYLCVVVVLSFI